MKKIILLILSVCSFSLAFSQLKSGIATYTVPAGWSSSTEKSGIILTYSARKGDTCRIQLLNTEKTAITTKEAFVKIRKSKAGAEFEFSRDLSTVSMTDVNGIVSICSRSVENPAKPEQRYFIYSFSNKTQTFFVLFYCNNVTLCKDAMNAFISNLVVELPVTETGTSGTHIKAKRKAAGAAPAAPAPIM